MQVICLEEEAFYSLVTTVVKKLKTEFSIHRDKWVSEEEAMKMLGITSKTTLQKYRDEGRIRYSQPDKKPIYYDSESIDLYKEKHARETF